MYLVTLWLDSTHIWVWVSITNHNKTQRQRKTAKQGTWMMWTTTVTTQGLETRQAPGICKFSSLFFYILLYWIYLLQGNLRDVDDNGCRGRQRMLTDEQHNRQQWQWATSTTGTTTTTMGHINGPVCHVINEARQRRAHFINEARLARLARLGQDGRGGTRARDRCVSSP
jgi:hypothetical protein